jgi:uncharacterized protein (TIGR02246 family)
MALIFGGALAARTAAGATDDEAAGRDVIARHAAAHETGDLEAIEKLWAHDETVTVAEGGSFNYGWTDFRDHHLRPEIEAMKNVKFPIEDIKVQVKGDLAWATYSYRMNGQYKGSLYYSAGAATMVLEKRNGAWLIVHEHTSAKRRQAPPKPEQ